MNGEKSNKLLQLEGITKTFGKVVANDQISLELYEGEVLALLGENGAGKSTLMNIIYGIYHPDAGKIMIRDKEVKISSPRSALNKGIGMVHQHFMLVGRYNAIENVCLISKSSPFTYLNKKKVAASLEELKARYGIDVDINCPVEQLSISGQQKIEILKLFPVFCVLFKNHRTENMHKANKSAVDCTALFIMKKERGFPCVRYETGYKTGSKIRRRI